MEEQVCCAEFFKNDPSSTCTCPQCRHRAQRGMMMSEEQSRTPEEIAELVKRLREYRAHYKDDSRVWSPSTVWLHFESAADALESLLSQLHSARAEAMESAALIFEKKALVHAAQATWMGPERQRYEGARIKGVEMSPMNGPAIAYDREMANAQLIRSLAPRTGEG